MSNDRNSIPHSDDDKSEKETLAVQKQEVTSQESKSEISHTIDKNAQLAAIYFLIGEFNIAMQYINEAIKVKSTPESLLLQFNIHLASEDFPGDTYKSLENASRLESHSPTINYFMCWNQLASYRKKTLSKPTDTYYFTHLCSNSINVLENSVLKDSFRFLYCLGVLIQEHYPPLKPESISDPFCDWYEKYAKQSSRFEKEYKMSFDTIINIRKNLRIIKDPPFILVERGPLIEIVKKFLEREWKLISLYSFSHTLVKNSLLENLPNELTSDIDKVKITATAFNAFFNQLNLHEQQLLIQSIDVSILQLLTHDYLHMRTLELEEKQSPINLNKINKMKNLLSLVADVGNPQFQLLAGQLGWYIYNNNQNIDDKNEQLNNLQDAFLFFSQALFLNKIKNNPLNIELNNYDITHFILYIFDSLKRDFLKTESTIGLQGEVDLSNFKLDSNDLIILNQILIRLKNTFGIQASESDFINFMTTTHPEESKNESLELNVDYIKKPISLMDFIKFLRKCFLDIKKNPSDIFLTKFKNRMEDLADAMPVALALLQPGQGINLKNELKQIIPVQETILQQSTADSAASRLVKIKKQNSLSVTIPFKFIPDILPSFGVGYALVGNDSFFDSAAQAIYQVTYDSRGFVQKLQELGMDPKEIEEKLSKVPNEVRGAKLFRMICAQYALQKMKEKESNWLKQYIETQLLQNEESLENYLKRMESVQSELYESKHSPRESLAGKPEIEGRILCNVFQIKIDVVEQDQQGQLKRKTFDDKSVIFPFGMPKFKTINLGYHDGQFVPILKPSHFNIDKEISIELDSLKERNQSASSGRRRH